VLDAILMERAGTPAVAIITEPFRATGEAMTAAWGMTGYPFLATPHPIANLADKELDERADRLLEAVELLLSQRRP
jgi:acetyl-CoA carboxylase beta subunit